MALLPTCQAISPDANFNYLKNDGTPSAPVITGNPVQLCTGGPFAGASGNVDTITASGVAGTSVLTLGNAGLANCMSFGPGQSATLTSQVLMVPNANLRVGQFTQIVINDDPAVVSGSGALTVNANGRVDMLPGSVMDFNNAGAPLSTFRNTAVLPTPIPDGTTQILANPPLIVPGVYAVMISTPAGDGFPQRQISTVAFWSGTVWVGGSVVAANNLEMTPSNDRGSMTLINQVGGNINNASVTFIQLVGGVAP